MCSRSPGQPALTDHFGMDRAIYTRVNFRFFTALETSWWGALPRARAVVAFRAVSDDADDDEDDGDSLVESFFEPAQFYNR